MKTRGAVHILEIVIAVVILGLLAAFAIPRFGQAAGAPDESGLLRDRLKVLRVAIERYYQDHHAYPATTGDGLHPAGSAEAFMNQLMAYTDQQGTVAEARDAVHRFGPYLRDGIPPCPLAEPDCATVVGVVDATGPAPQHARADVGWLYCPQTGRITANVSTTDSSGRPYSLY